MTDSPDTKSTSTPLQRSGLALFTVSVFVTLVLGGVGLPWALLVFVTIIPALQVSKRAHNLSRDAKRKGEKPAPGLAAMRGFHIISLVLAFTVIAQVVAQAAMWSLTMNYQDCMKNALSPAAERRCTIDYEHSIFDRLGVERPN